jgi:hypothetical protein
MRPALRRSALAVTATLTLLAIGPSTSVAADATTPAPTTPAPPVGSCAHPDPDVAVNVAYRWRSRVNMWRARPVSLTTIARRSPSMRAARVAVLAATTEHARQTAWYLVLDARQVGDTCWLNVRLPADPNDRQGWVLRDELVVERSYWQVEVDLSDRRVRAYSRGRVRLNARVVIGARATPTPTSGTARPFAIYDAVQGNPNAFTGSWQLATTAYSSYSRSLGRIGLHGRGGASLSAPLGTAASNGCIRMANADVSLLVRRIGLARVMGAPVLIVS